MIDMTREKLIWARTMAQRLSIDQRTLERRFKDGLESIKIGRRVYTTIEALDRFTQQQNSNATACKKCGRKPDGASAAAAPAVIQKRKPTKRQAELQPPAGQECVAARAVSTELEFFID